ncbi:AlpA family transcriptional regulator [Ralstonia pseudosolanacearum]|uniref:Putative prophage regulatory transcription regulator protein n=1 Tax=Ralstonia solanacearum TaxID=305 RepID=A0A0S4TUU9_RALSL|nr:AlpA family transcriptional regulator [Ralstonia solanacearum]OAI80578.1 regulatory protein [Ralstonia solanacearum]CUV13818.1 putative prophage regulatory transcription regulator protein [Ralstonia solanacearum]
MKAINIKQVAEKVSLGQSTIYRMIAKGEFPKPFSLGTNRTAWLDEDIDAWLAMKAGRPIPKPGVTLQTPLS